MKVSADVRRQVLLHIPEFVFKGSIRALFSEINHTYLEGKDNRINNLVNMMESVYSLELQINLNIIDTFIIIDQYSFVRKEHKHTTAKTYRAI